MKRIIASILCLSLILLFPLSAFADIQMPQVYSWEDDIARDFNGNPVTDCWAYDPSQETEKYVLLDGEGKLIDQSSTFQVEGIDTAEKGWIEVEAILPEELQQYDVLVSILGDYEGYEFHLYQDNSHKALKEVLAGTYHIDVAMIAGDTNNQYPATFEGEVTVYPNSTAALLKVDFTQEPEVTETEEPEVTEPQEVVEEGPGLLQYVVIGILVLIIVAGIFIFIKIKQNE